MKTVEEIVEALSQALVNGYEEVLTMTPRAVACDLIDQAYDFEHEEPEDIEAAVAEAQDKIRAQRRIRQVVIHDISGGSIIEEKG